MSSPLNFDWNRPALAVYMADKGLIINGAGGVRCMRVLTRFANSHTKSLSEKSERLKKET
jgi:hypothetical protein